MDRELAAGFLVAEGVLHSADDLGAIGHCRHPHHPEVHNIVDVYLVGRARRDVDTLLEQRRNVLTTSSCGLRGRLTIESLALNRSAIDTPVVFDRERAASLPGMLRRRQAIFDQTGGLHAAAVFRTDGTCDPSRRTSAVITPWTK
jgi:FdhD protein